MTAFSINFSYIPIWVQVWGLPFDLINEEAGRDIGSGIGWVANVDCKAIPSDQACFLRVQVKMPLNKPIQRRAPVINPKGDRVSVAFQYERLLGLCFDCGFLGHEAKACIKEKLRYGSDSPYGDWLRAGYRKQSDKSRNKPTSPPRWNMEENDVNRNANLPLQPPTNSELGTSRGKFSEHVTVIEIMEKHVTAFTDACEIDGLSPNPLGGSLDNRVPMVLNCENGINQEIEIIGDRLVNVPILYEQQSLDKTIPLATKVLVESGMNSLSSDQQKHGMPQVCRWRKIKKTQRPIQG